MPQQPAPLDPLILERIVRMALEEDLGRAGDITSNACIPASKQACALMRTREEGVLAGLDAAVLAFKILDPKASITCHKTDGDLIKKGETLLTVEGNARALLSAERTALNIVQRLSAIATKTAECVSMVAHTKARITDTRKTTPGLRTLEKYAVRCGGGLNHRFGLDDAILIKDNHIAVAGGITAALYRAREAAGHMVKIEIEVDTLTQLQEVLSVGIAHIVLLDNMPPATLREAVALAEGRVILEASGGITPQTLKAVAETGVDVISLGALTHSIKALDIGLDIEVES
jgi:nicotinate-nucleotide pyrophosphorylase (carboxylating)